MGGVGREALAKVVCQSKEGAEEAVPSPLDPGYERQGDCIVPLREVVQRYRMDPPGLPASVVLANPISDMMNPLERPSLAQCVR